MRTTGTSLHPTSALSSSTYKGQMYDRYLMGEWAWYEGLVYPQWNDAVHTVPHTDMLNYMDELSVYRRYQFNWVEGYDFGIASPSCYLLGFVDPEYKLHIVAGFHRRVRCEGPVR